MLPLGAALDLIVIGWIFVGISDCPVKPDLGLHKAHLLVLWAEHCTMLRPNAIQQSLNVIGQWGPTVPENNL